MHWHRAKVRFRVYLDIASKHTMLCLDSRGILASVFARKRMLPHRLRRSPLPEGAYARKQPHPAPSAHPFISMTAFKLHHSSVFSFATQQKSTYRMLGMGRFLLKYWYVGHLTPNYWYENPLIPKMVRRSFDRQKRGT